MYPFVESVALSDGAFRNLEYHDARIERTQRFFYGHYSLPPLREILMPTGDSLTGLWKCRMEYGRQQGPVSFTPYKPRMVNSLYLVDAPEVEYAFKFSNRALLSACRDTFFAREGLNADDSDIIMVQNGCITDSSYANVVLLMDDGSLSTPDTPLLKGTMRAFLLHEGRIRERRLTVADARQARGALLINAMLPLDLSRMITRIV